MPAALAAVQDPGPHGLSEILYAYSSATGNNGSAFAGFGAALPFHTTLQGVAMLLGRFAFIVPMLAIAGSLAAKTPAPPSAGTFPTHGPLFVVLLIATVLILGALTFFPALALGPIAERSRCRRPDLLIPERSHVPQGRAAALRPRRSSPRPLATAFRKLDPRTLVRNPVIFVTEVVALLTTLDPRRATAFGAGSARRWPDRADHGLALAHRALRQLRRGGRRGPRQGAAASLRATQAETAGKKLPGADAPHDAFETVSSVAAPRAATSSWSRPATSSRPTARSSRASPRSTRAPSPASRAPVIRESGGDRSAVTGGTRLVSDWLVVRVTAEPGESFLDRMIALVEGAERQKTPNEIALNILLVGFTLIFLFVVVDARALRRASPAPRSRSPSWSRCSSR